MLSVRADFTFQLEHRYATVDAPKDVGIPYHKDDKDLGMPWFR